MKEARVDCDVVQALLYDQTAQLNRLPTTSSGNIYGSTFPNSPGWTYIVSGTNIGGRSRFFLNKLFLRNESSNLGLI